MFCIKCGAQVDDDAVFCSDCGERVVRPEMRGQKMGGYVQGRQPQDEYSQRRQQQGRRLESEFYRGEHSQQRRPQGRRIENRNVDNGYGRNQSAHSYKKIKSGINSGETGWRAYITPGNMERFAPAYLLALIPLMIIATIFEDLSFGVYYTASIASDVLSVLATIMKILTVLLGVVASASLIYVAITQKKKADVKKWIVPATVSATTAICFFAYFMEKHVATTSLDGEENAALNVIIFLLSLVSFFIDIAVFVLGLEFFARITIEGNPMESPINVKAALETYKRLFYEAKAKAIDENESELEIEYGVYDTNFSNISRFDGSGLQLFGYILLTILVSSITCTLALPWMICKIYRWKVEHTIINGKRLMFIGTGWSLFGHMILWELLTVITCGIYFGFMRVAIRKWELKYTYIEGEPVPMDVFVSQFDGSGWAYLGYSLLSLLLCFITCSFAFPWTMSMIQKWDTSHQIINNKRLTFDGSGMGFLGQFILIFLLSIITCGLYMPWAIVRMNKYVIRHTKFC